MSDFLQTDESLACHKLEYNHGWLRGLKVSCNEIKVNDCFNQARNPTELALIKQKKTCIIFICMFVFFNHSARLPLL